MWICEYTKTSKPLCNPGCDLSLRDTRFLPSRGFCATCKPRSQWEFCAAWVQGDTQQLKPRKMAPGMLSSSCYCWLIGIWEVGKVILNAKNGTLKKQLLVLSSERPRQQKGFPFWNGQQNLLLSLCKVRPLLASITPRGQACVMWQLCFGTDSKYIIQQWTGLSALTIPLMQPLHLAVGSDLSLALEQLCHWRVKKGWETKFIGRGTIFIWAR